MDKNSPVKIFLDFVRKHKENIIICAIVLLGLFIRLYKIDGYLTFLGDEGRDVVVVRRLLVNKDLIFVGPGTSVGNMYLGPLYYYMMAPFLWAFKLSPVGPAVGIALLGTATIWLIIYVFKKMCPTEGTNYGALISGLLYSLSPVIVSHAKTSWNPNIMPFFALLTFYYLWQMWITKRFKYLFVAAAFFTVMTQSHYMGLVILPFALLVYLSTAVKIYKENNKKREIIFYSLLSVIVFLLLTSPLIIFDAKYDWRNLLAIRDFFTTQNTGVSFSPISTLKNIVPTFQLVITRLLAAKVVFLGQVISLLFVAVLISISSLRKNKAFLFLSIFFVISILGLSLYQKDLYDHYFGFLFFAPFMFVGFVVNAINSLEGKLFKILLGLIILIMISASIVTSPLREEPQYQLRRTGEIAQKMIEESKGERFNFAVIADQNYEGAYQYFLEQGYASFVLIDPQRYTETRTNLLFVVCEYSDVEKCQPASNPKAGIANFGWSKIESFWDIRGIRLFKLVPNNKND